MLTFLPLLLLVLIVIFVEVVSRSKLNIGNQWLFLVLSVLLVFGAFLFMRSHLPAPVTINNWLPVVVDLSGITFQLDVNSWTLSFGLIALLAAMVLADTIHLHEQTNIRSWSRIILLVCLGLLGAIAHSLLAFILIWTLIDIIEIVTYISSNKGASLSGRSVIVFFTHLMGILMLLRVFVSQTAAVTSLATTILSSGEVTLLILAAGLRMTIYDNTELAHEKKTTIKMLQGLRKVISPFLAMALLAKLPEITGISGLLVWVLLICTGVVLYAAFAWIKNPSIENGVMAFSALSVISVLRNNTEGVISWAILMIVFLGWGEIYTYRSKNYLPFILLVGLSAVGLPISISFAGADSLVTPPIGAVNFLLWIGMALLAAGFIRSNVQPSPARSPEVWMKLLYIIGIGLLAITPWLPGIWKLKESLESGFVWASIFVSVLAAAIVFFMSFEKARASAARFIPERVRNAAARVDGISIKPIAAGSILDLANSFYELLRRVINGINDILEGEGGILWALVVLVLLLSLLMSKVGG